MQCFAICKFHECAKIHSTETQCCLSAVVMVIKQIHAIMLIGMMVIDGAGANTGKKKYVSMFRLFLFGPQTEQSTCPQGTQSGRSKTLQSNYSFWIHFEPFVLFVFDVMLLLNDYCFIKSVYMINCNDRICICNST